MFIHIGEPAEVFAGSNETRSETDSAVLDMNLDDLELSARSLNCLKKANVSTIGELMGYSAAEMMKFKNFGLKSLKEVREKLSEYKLSLKGEGKEK